MSTFIDLISDANVRWVLGGTLLLGISSGLLGSFAMLRRRSLMGDVLAHAALPGVCIAFMGTQSKSVAPLLLGAVIAGLAGVWCVDTITRHSRIKEDTAQGMVLTVFFGFGIVLLTQIARSGAAGQSGLDRFLFGQAASIIGSDVKVIGATAAILAVGIFILFKEFKLLAFDPGFGAGIGFPMRTLDRLLMLMVVVGVAIGLQAVGVVLMAALLITPAAAARYWTQRLEIMVVLAGLFGALSGMAGTLISLSGSRLATGPLVVLAATGLFLVSLTLGTHRGLVHKMWRHLKVRQRVAQENLLRVLYEAYESQGMRESATGGSGFELAPVSDVALAAGLGVGAQALQQHVGRAVRNGWVERVVEADAAADPTVAAETPAGRGRGAASGHGVRLTTQGLAQAHRVVRRHRLWEMFLMYEADFAVDHVDRDADDIEHHLPPDVVAELERRLKGERREPVVPPSVHPL